MERGTEVTEVTEQVTGVTERDTEVARQSAYGIAMRIWIWKRELMDM